MKGDSPLVESANLVRMLRTHLRVDTTPADLEKPTPEVVRTVFEALANRFDGSTRFDFSTVRCRKLHGLFATVEKQILFHCRVQSALRRLNVLDWDYQDVVLPKKERFLSQLSGVYSFLQCHRCLEEQAKESRVDLEHENKRKECITLSRLHDQSSKKHIWMTAEFNKSKDEMNEAISEYDRCNREYKELKQAIKEPTNAIQMEMQNLNEMQEAIAKISCKDSYLENQICLMTKYGTDTRKDIYTLQRIKLFDDSDTRNKNKVKEMKLKFEKENHSYEELQRKVHKLKRDCENELEDLTHEKQQLELMQQELESALLQKESEKCSAEEGNLEIERTAVAQGNAKVQEIRQRSKAMKDRHVFVINRTLHNAKLLEDAFRSWTKTI